MQFTDVSQSAGIDDAGISFGASAGDVDGDGWPDIFTNGHYSEHPRLWWNLHNGTFWDVSLVMSPYPTGDLHGAQWVDLDGDGTQELVLLRGANYGLTPTPKYVYRRFGYQLFDIASYVGLDVPLMRARTPLALDFDRDGRLDVFLSAVLRADGQQPPAPYRQAPSGVFGHSFSDAGPVAGYSASTDTLFAVLGDVDGDHACDLLCHGFPVRAYSMASGTLQDVTNSVGLPPMPAMSDIVLGDFDGDAENEIYVARDWFGSSFHVEGDRRVEWRAIVQGNEQVLRIPVAGPHWLIVDWGPEGMWTRQDVFVGATGYHPAQEVAGLLSTNTWNHGIKPHAPGQVEGIYIGFDPAASEWTITVTSRFWHDIMVRAVADVPVGQPYPVGWSPSSPGPADMLLRRVNGTYQNQAAARGIPATLGGHAAVAADFDNDMDLDIFVVTSTSSRNTDDVLLRNDGTGVFQPVPAGAAAGSPHGVGDSVITLDYNRDGKVDLFVVNGDSMAFRWNCASDAFADNGPAQLLRNDTQNGNHWLGIHLVGAGANREAIGARIEVTAGGKLQVREHGGGMHRYSQNHGIHFGLGPNTIATKVEVIWPNGAHTVRTNVPADQLLFVTQ